MFDFKYFTPTKVLFGKNTEDKVADLIQEFGGKKVLIHYGGGSVIRSGLMQKVTDKLDAAGIKYVKLGGAVPNPRLSLVYEGIELCKKIRQNSDFDKTKLIVTSILHDKELILTAGADLYIPKPYEISNLIKWVEKLLNG